MLSWVCHAPKPCCPTATLCCSWHDELSMLAYLASVLQVSFRFCTDMPSCCRLLCRFVFAASTLMCLPRAAAVDCNYNQLHVARVDRLKFHQNLQWLTHCLVVKDRFPADLEGAVAAVRSRGDTATADVWQEALDNLTMGTPGACLIAHSMLSSYCLSQLPAQKEMKRKGC